MFSYEYCEFYKQVIYRIPPAVAFVLIFGGLSIIMLNKSGIGAVN